MFNMKNAIRIIPLSKNEGILRKQSSMKVLLSNLKYLTIYVHLVLVLKAGRISYSILQ